jgi:hypothetical protein
MGNYLDGYGKQVCGHCEKKRTSEGHDGCIGTLENVMNACCGHGESNLAYVQFDHDDYQLNPNKHLIKGYEALEYIKSFKTI